jgi:hypothetical protein
MPSIFRIILIFATNQPAKQLKTTLVGVVLLSVKEKHKPPPRQM